MSNKLLDFMLQHADPAQVAGLARFFKTGPGQYGEGDKFLGIKVPVTRAVIKECWRDTGWEDLEECISSEYHEVRLAALLTLVEIFKHAGRRSPIRSGMTKGASGMTEEECINFYLSHTDRINNWDLVDLSCYPLLGEWFLDKDRTLLYDLARSGKTMWEQRIGIVSTLTFIRHGQLQDTFDIADILLHHPHDLIHKAVGWMLREAGKRDKAALVAYLNEIPGTSPRMTQGETSPRMTQGETSPRMTQGETSPKMTRASQMPRTMLRYAIEKFPEEERQYYLAK